MENVKLWGLNKKNNKFVIILGLLIMDNIPTVVNVFLNWIPLIPVYVDFYSKHNIWKWIIRLPYYDS